MGVCEIFGVRSAANKTPPQPAVEEALRNCNDLIFQNPPFGSQSPGADVPFIEAAIRCSHVIYSIHNGNTEDFLIKKITELGVNVTYRFKDRITIPHTFQFHSKEKQDIEVIVLKIASNG